ncbi:putative family with sequence similarity 13 [Operophtera brumata]|uniref:Putative family with sequence similarity 13 n=1 Tax=Operophtera brumata TaxID=104452 RepID=A0A0L7LK91_OPEBR|nr:putative family with sequence similarity 13 [Operophtera brumata]
MVQLDGLQGFGAHGHDSDCSSERRVVLTSLGWRAQCCQEEREGERERAPEDMAAPECEREARKRRERRDSGCAHERKERRPHSEERLPPPPPTPPLQDYNRLESERRAERLSRARRPQFGVKRRRPPVRVHKPPKENDCYTREVIRCSTPPNFDYAVVLKPTIEDFAAEEAEIAAELTAAERARRDERNATHNNARREQPCPNRRLEKIAKKIIVLKKSIANYEADYESQNERPLTPSDRITDVQLTQMYESLRRLQAEKRCIKTDPVEYALKVQAAKAQKDRDDRLDVALKSDKSMFDVVRDIEDWLEGCRQAGGRAAIPESCWSSSQLASEKSCVQRALLRLEAARGRPPAHSADRGAARHLYERYRTVKRVLASSRPDAVSIKSCVQRALLRLEAARGRPPAHSADCGAARHLYERYRTVKRVLASSRPDAVSIKSCVQRALLRLEAARGRPPAHSADRGAARHLYERYRTNSRKVQRDDKKDREEDYIRYKTIKARIKLINALINKQKTLTKVNKT